MHSSELNLDNNNDSNNCEKENGIEAEDKIEIGDAEEEALTVENIIIENQDFHIDFKQKCLTIGMLLSIFCTCKMTRFCVNYFYDEQLNHFLAWLMR